MKQKYFWVVLLFTTNCFIFLKYRCHRLETSFARFCFQTVIYNFKHSRVVVGFVSFRCLVKLYEIWGLWVVRGKVKASILVQGVEGVRVAASLSWNNITLHVKLSFFLLASSAKVTVKYIVQCHDVSKNYETVIKTGGRTNAAYFLVFWNRLCGSLTRDETQNKIDTCFEKKVHIGMYISFHIFQLFSFMKRWVFRFQRDRYFSGDGHMYKIKMGLHVPTCDLQESYLTRECL